MGAVVVDASVVLALLDPSDTLHVGAVGATRTARSTGSTFVLPASALAEVLVGAAVRGETDEVRRRVLRAFGPVAPLDEAVAVAAAGRRARHPALRLPDAVVLATADVVGAESVLTGDRRWVTLDPRVVLVRPSGGPAA